MNNGVVETGKIVYEKFTITASPYVSEIKVAAVDYTSTTLEAGKEYTNGKVEDAKSYATVLQLHANLQCKINWRKQKL